ncbi:hypothetical protein [Planococcus halotolerans]|uniref:Uncharacterized protein n=1 Tax=Planococcus halotolerans TaxID=2233542 RepID=A0A365KKH1_9BACL|nr:hypothetical protein [Planococcus halotolerans]RAZ73637.1 hypothetical protein DP120_17020 [Planococcus halotolerans]
MNPHPNFKEGLTFIDLPKRSAIIHYRYNGILVVRLVFNFAKGEPDELDDTLKHFMGFESYEEEEKFLISKRQEAWKKFCSVREREI